MRTRGEDDSELPYPWLTHMCPFEMTVAFTQVVVNSENVLTKLDYIARTKLVVVVSLVLMLKVLIITQRFSKWLRLTCASLGSSLVSHRIQLSPASALRRARIAISTAYDA